MTTKRTKSQAKTKRASSVKKAKSAKSEAVTASPLTPASRPALIFAWVGFWLVLLFSCSWVGVHAYLVDTVTVRLCEMSDQGIAAEARMPVFLSEIAMDGYVWNRHAEKIGSDGSWRLRHTDLDNAPSGREVHWNSAFAWYLRGLGEAYRAIHGDSLRNSIFRMSIWSNPILLVLLIAIFSPLAARRFGPMAGSILAIGMVAVPTFYEGFLPAYPDHHGIIAFAIFAMVFGIAWAGAGWVRSEESEDFAAAHSRKQARRGMIFSGIFGAIGLWISALSMAIVLGSVGLAAIVATWIFARKQNANPASEAYHPELWKTWALAGATTAFGLYLLEYFPSHLGLRLEVNHPLYGLAWLGGGWLVAEFGVWVCLGRGPFPWKRFVLPLAACLVLPGTILMAGSGYYLPFDPFMQRLHENIAEFLPLLVRMKFTGLSWQVAFGLFPIFLITAWVLLAFPRVGRGTRAVLFFLSVPIVLITALQFYQVRWGMLAGPLYIALAAIVVPQSWRLIPRKAIPRAVAAVVLAGMAYFFVNPSFQNVFKGTWSQYRSPKELTVNFGQAIALLHRQMAFAIKQDAGDESVVILSSPNSSCLLSGLGGFRTVGTLYWENRDGLLAAATALNAQSADEANQQIAKLGVTHVALVGWENFIEPYFKLLHPEASPVASFERSFGKQALFDKVIPPTLRPLSFVPDSVGKMLKQDILIARFAPNQSRHEAEYYVARYAWLVQDNAVAAEIAFKRILDAAPESNRVRADLVEMYFAQRRFDEAADQAIFAMPGTPLDWRKHFAKQVADRLNAAGKPDLAAKVLTAEGK